MKARAKSAMLVLSAAVLSGAWLVAEANVRGPGAEEVLAETDPSPEPIALALGPAEGITALSWSWEGETVNLRRTAAGGWENTDDPACPVDDEAAEALAEAAADTAASLAVPEAGELSQYGLDKPKLTVMAAAGEVIVRYDVGNMTIAGEYYVRRDGTDTVYTENGALAAFRVGTADILALETIPADVGQVTGLSVTSAAESYQLLLEPEGWFRTDGTEPAALDGDRTEELLGTVTDLDLTDCVAWSLEDPADYGLRRPQVTAELDYRDDAGAERSVRLEFGDYVEGDVYVRFAGSSLVYRTDAAAADRLMYPPWEAMIPETVLTFDPAAAASLTLAAGNRTGQILRLEETSERPAGEEDETVAVTEVIYSCGGRVLDTEEVEGWLADLCALRTAGTAPGAEGRQTLLSLTVTWKDEESPPAVLELRRYDSVHCLCLLGEDRCLLVPRADAEALALGAEAILKGP